MSLLFRMRLAIFLLLALAVAVALTEAGLYGWTLFAIVPFAAGFLGAMMSRPSTAGQAAALGAGVMLAGCVALACYNVEGIVCIVLALPLVVAFGVLGALASFHLTRSQANPRSRAMLLLPIATLTWDIKAPPPVFSVTTQVVVHASPRQVWKRVVAFPKLPEAREWIFRVGLAYPTEARIDGSGPGAIRRCQFSTGPFVEPITIWDEPRRLAFRVTENPPPLQEWSLWGPVHPKHLSGYFVSERGQFDLKPLRGGRTLLTGTTWYRHGLWPAGYWRWWSDAIIHRIHLRFLNHIRNLAETNG